MALSIICSLREEPVKLSIEVPRQRFWLRGHAVFMGYMGPVQLGYGVRTFSVHINNGEAHIL